jgi:tetratricopeptide (TPR) repeat protein
MTCSSSTISTPDRAGGAGWFAILAAAACLVALPIAASAQNAGQRAASLIESAKADLARGDGIAAEVRLRQAMTAGAPRGDVAAMLGAAYLHQNQPEKAAQWLEGEQFSPTTAAGGYRALALLKRQRRDLAGAGLAYDKALALTPNDAGLWAEVATLRYAGGDHLAAIDAADRALKLDPANSKALAFRAMLVRDAHGLAASLPWFEAALRASPRDLEVLGEYAATLGDLGRATDMLKATRTMIGIDPRSPRAFYLQAVMAARAGQVTLARRLLAKAGKGLDRVPGALLLRGTLELASGNAGTAVDTLARLAAMQPANVRVRHLLARALYLSGQHTELEARFAGLAGRRDAAPYLLTLLARMHEAAGRRDLAAPLLDRAASEYSRPVFPVAGSALGEMIAAGDRGGAQTFSAQALAAGPGNAAARIAVGDVALAAGQPVEALVHYRTAAKVKLDEALLVRMAVALEAAGGLGDAADLVHAFHLQNPSSLVAARLAARLAADRGDWGRAALLLDHARASGSERDAHLLVDLSRAQARAGAASDALATAREAWALQRGSGYTAQALGLALRGATQEPANARALLAKARAMGADLGSLPAVRYVHD